MQKKVAIIQSNYIPWLGYFDIIANVDEFILYDEVQYTKRDWRNRNKIKTPQGTQWLTVPVKTKGKYEQTIRETEILDNGWQAKHWNSLLSNYRQSEFQNEILELLYDTYHKSHWTYLSNLNYSLLLNILQYLEINTKVSWSSDYKAEGERSQRLASIALQAKATHYISGPAAKNYLKADFFIQNNVIVEWFDYSNLGPYDQLWGHFVPNLSIIDALMNVGVKTRRLLPSAK